MTAAPKKIEGRRGFPTPMQKLNGNDWVAQRHKHEQIEPMRDLYKEAKNAEVIVRSLLAQGCRSRDDMMRGEVFRYLARRRSYLNAFNSLFHAHKSREAAKARSHGETG